MLRKALFAVLLSSISLVSFAQNNPNMRDRVEQRMENRSNGDMRQDGAVDRTQNVDDVKRDGSVKGVSKAGFAVCAGEFALCASSTCKPTGKTITVQEDGGKTTKQYPEAICKCPVITPQIAQQNGVALAGIAGLNEGNMKGSCRSPGTGKIWSYFSLTVKTYPQEQPDGSFMQPTASTIKIAQLKVLLRAQIAGAISVPVTLRSPMELRQQHAVAHMERVYLVKRLKTIGAMSPSLAALGAIHKRHVRCCQWDFRTS
jgi:hypothetical protein